ncbi:MAG: hypothetical protein JXA67_10560, partial [Micromonosporaceae bacterium]|nr:hypothetical protein [Micromonosporaceae bacterium]
MTHRLPDPHGRFTALDRLRFVGRRGLDWVVTIAESFMDRSADLIPLAQRSTRFLAAVAVTAWGAAMRLLRRTLDWPGWLRLRHALSRCVPVFSTVSNVLRRRSVITCVMVAALSLPLAGSVSAFSGGTKAGTAGDGGVPVGQRRGTSLDVSGHDAESGKGAKSKKQ